MPVATTISQRLDVMRGRLARHGQDHLLRFADELNDAGRESLLGQLEGIDFARLDALVSAHLDENGPGAVPEDVEPAPYYPCPPVFRGVPAADGAGAFPPALEEHRDAGVELIRRGALAIFTVAGGQGTRLGWNGPKGTYPATPVTGKPLFRCFAEQVIAAQRTYGVSIPWYIMTSPENDAATRSFFLDNNLFGLLRRNVTIFPQGLMPSVEAATGRVLLASRGQVALNPDGHGGAIQALSSSGALDDMSARGVEQISYFQVDNPLIRVVDPLFVGLHVGAPDSSGQMSSKMVAKRSPDERVGVFRAGGRTIVIEYSDLPEELAHQRDEQQRLRFNAGSIAVHLMSVAFAKELAAAEDDHALPFHRALKRVPYVDIDSGRQVEPEEPNAVKFERFIFDALPRAASSIVLETDRSEEFAPIKNAKGEDSPATSHQMQCARAARWLEGHGVSVPRDEEGRIAARIEISPLTALEPADLVAVDLPRSISPGEEIVL